MDIQLPVMDRLDATKETWQLERLNGIDIFSKTDSGGSSISSPNTKSPSTERLRSQRSPGEEDTLANVSLLRNPVVVVSLTASSLQSDRRDALVTYSRSAKIKMYDFPTLPLRCAVI